MTYTRGNPEKVENDLHAIVHYNDLDALWSQVIALNFPPDIQERLNREYNKKLLLFAPQQTAQFSSFFILQSDLLNLALGSPTNAPADSLFQYDANGNVQISPNGQNDLYFELDSNSNVQPR